MKTIVSMKFGSHLYGTDTPESDLDYKAVHIPPAQDILLQRVKGSLCTKREKREGEKNVAGEVDEESYSLQRYLSLLSDGQTVAIDMLFAPQSVQMESSDLWRYIQANSDRFLTKKSAAFVGYCRTQANKYGIKGSRVAAAKDAVELFAAEMGKRGYTAKIEEIADLLPMLVGEHTQLVEQPMTHDGTLGWFLEVCNRKVAFSASIKQGHEIFSRIYENYGKRAQLAEKNEGVDWKALSHAVRVGREAIELLQTGAITFPLRDARHILDIKKGRVEYAIVAEEIEGLLAAVEEAAPTSMLREEADYNFIDTLVAEAYSTQF